MGYTENKPNSNSVTQHDLEALQSLLLGDRLEEALTPTPQAIADVLPAAFQQAQTLRPDLPLFVIPTIETAIQASVQTDATILSEALFPVIGPATRKSISAAIGNLIQSLNQTLEHSLSLESLKWRLEARRTGKSFAEIVLLRTLVYQVEQVLLIHRETGLVLQEIRAESAIAQDPDLVSAMLTAIQDFVRDSFAVSNNDAIDKLKVGEFSLWIENGPQAALVCVIRGNAPQTLHLLMQRTIERIHLSFGRHMARFEGDQTALEDTQRYLEECLQVQFKPKGTWPGPALVRFLPNAIQKQLGIVVACLLALVFGWLSLSNWQSHQSWQRFVDDLAQQPGIVIIDQGQRWGHYWLSGLKDPLATNPEVLLASTSVEPSAVTMRWQPYLSLEPAFAGDRASMFLQPPPTVSLDYELETSTMHVSGTASEEWIQQAYHQQKTLLSNISWQTQHLTSPARIATYRLVEQIKAQQFEFMRGHPDIRVSQTARMQQQILDIKQLIAQTNQFGQTPHITLIGHGDLVAAQVLTTPSREDRELGQLRADTLRNQLVQAGIPSQLVTAKGKAASSSSMATRRKAHPTASSITFRINLSG